MHCSLTKMEFESLIHSEFENRFTGVKIPELEIIFDPKSNKVSVFACTDESSDTFVEALLKHKLLLKANQFFVFINGVLLMKLFYSSYRVNHDSIDFYEVLDFGLTDFEFTVSNDGHLSRFTISAGNIMHAYLKALINPKWGQLVAYSDLKSIEATSY